MKKVCNARWRMKIDTEADTHMAEFIVETQEGDLLCKMLLTKTALWQLAKAAMDTGDYLNDLEKI